MLDNDKYKLLAALAIGAAGGLFVGNYICKKHDISLSLSKHLSMLSKVVEQVENVDVDDVSNIKERVQNILNSIESTYGNTKE